MTPWQKRVTALTRRMADDMKLRNYSQNTIDSYTYHVARFAQFLARSPEQAVPEDVRSFQLHLIRKRATGRLLTVGLTWRGFRLNSPGDPNEVACFRSG